MTRDTVLSDPFQHLFGRPEGAERFAGIDDRHARRAGDPRQDRRQDRRDPAAGPSPTFPPGRTYLAQFVMHDLDFLTREGTAEGAAARPGADLRRRPPARRLRLSGSDRRRRGAAPAAPRPRPPDRHLARPGAPRATCRASAARRLDARGGDPHRGAGPEHLLRLRTRCSRQMQTVWALLHNAISARWSRRAPAREAFEQARRITRGIYRDVVRADVLGTWLMAGCATATPPPRRARLSDGAAGARARASSWPGSPGSATGSCARSTPQRPLQVDGPAQPHPPDLDRAAARHAADRGLADRLLHGSSPSDPP